MTSKKLTLDEAKKLEYRDELHAGECYVNVGPKGGERLMQERWRVNGTPQTWKTRPNDVRVPIKYGLYGYGAIYPHNLEDFHSAKNCRPVRRHLR